MLKKFILALSVLAALATGSAFAQDNSANQQLATAVARKLSGSGKLNQYQLDIIVNGTTVELTGTVNDMATNGRRLIAWHMKCLASKKRATKLSIRGAIKPQAAQEQIPAPGHAPGAGAPGSSLCHLGPPTEPVPQLRAAGMAGLMASSSQLLRCLLTLLADLRSPYNNFSRVGYPNCLPS